MLTFSDPEDQPPEEVVIALGWPRTEREQLAQLRSVHQKRDGERYSRPKHHRSECTAAGILHSIQDDGFGVVFADWSDYEGAGR